MNMLTYVAQSSTTNYGGKSLKCLLIYIIYNINLKILIAHHLYIEKYEKMAICCRNVVYQVKGRISNNKEEGKIDIPI
ncbi:LOW QUALITY PROTEIN: hypothetical protein PFMC_01868 [Plasmodium falciparum CAMP/Malaysia]|uniref:Uncharacterized protein n=1 Tax=Plasmodium falciparum (isolate Camp / Malaysia) TaxID=5835 RepID=A0A024X9R5_PLAFC|nr:LOW QUALITY PROTEIN: hypothetical protein PFMC_01868 [Plasmodium falciparum CAMP/Malaysia]